MAMEATGTDGIPLLKPQRILLVEDNIVNQKVALILLEQLGLETDIAANGKEAVEAVAKHRYPLILMDCHMPEMDGFEATVAIRKLEELAGYYTPIIAVTALAMAGDRERCIAAGMNDYISKPIDKEVLQIKINHWLRTDVVYKTQKLRRKVLQPHTNMMLLEGAPINLSDLEEFYGQDQLDSVLQTFISNTEGMLAKLHSRMFEREIWSTARLAHELRSSCAAIGAKQLSRICLFIEQAVGQDDWTEANDSLSALDRNFAILKNFIESALVAEETV
jgi:CheY-like chemotaxis protein/HPt (histidine-containing phosphotransfer) domain-containing protein